MNLLLRIFSLVLALMLAPLVHAQIPDAFNPVQNSSVSSLVVQADGKVLIGGSFSTLDGVTRGRIARLNVDGSLDPFFIPYFDNIVTIISPQDDGKMVVAGSFLTIDGENHRNLARLNADGSVDSSFNPPSNMNRVEAVCVQPDGKILVANSLPGFSLVRLNSDGFVDLSFNVTIDNSVSAMAVQSDGSIIIGGNFNSVNGSPRGKIARLNADGSVQGGFNPGISLPAPYNSSVVTIGIQSDGRILLSGGFQYVAGVPRNYVARLNSDGSLDSGFNPNLFGPLASWAESFAVQSDGKIILGGYFTSIGGQPAKYLARLNQDGSLDTSFDPEVDDIVSAVVVQQDGKVLVSGSFSSVGGQPRNRIARLTNGPAFSILTVIGGSEIDWQRGDCSPEVFHTVFESWNGSNWVSVGQPIRVPGGWRKIGLSLPSSGWVRARARAGLGATSSNTQGGSSGLVVEQVIAYGSGPSSDIAVTVDGGSSLISGTDKVAFGSRNWQTTGAPKTVTITNTGDATLTGISASLVGAGASEFSITSPGSATLPPGGSTSFTVAFSPLGVGTRGTELLITSSDGDESPFRIGLEGVGRQADPNYLPNPSNSVLCIAMQPDGKAVVGGLFLNLGGQAHGRIARLNSDGILDTSFNPDANGNVVSVAVQPDGKILVAGNFTTLNGQTRNRIARLNIDGSLDAGFNPDANNSISTIAVQADGRILLGGSFTTIGGQTRNRIARINADGSLDTGFNPGADVTVFSIALQEDAKILIGGDFGNLGGQTRSKIGRLNTDGSVDATFNPSANSSVYALTPLPDGSILVGGNFSTMNGQSRIRIARLTGSGSLDGTFTAGATGQVYNFALQTDGKILVGGAFNTIGGVPRNRIARFLADGSLDPSFSPDANGSVFCIALQPDGTALVGGLFGKIGGQTCSSLARIINDPATRALTVTGNSQIDWQLGGSSPEPRQVVFDSWNGSTWLSLGPAVRTTGGWRVNGLSLPVGGWVRARGRVTGGQFAPASGLVEQIATYGTGSLPEIGVAVDGGSELLSGSGIVNFSGNGSTRTIRITNTGTASLTGLSATMTGTAAMDFTLGSLGNAELLPNQSTTATVTFSSTASGARGATLHILSNDADESPFTVLLQADSAPSPYQVETSFNPVGDSSVYSLALQPDGKILVGGNFSHLGGQSVNRIGRLDAGGNLDSSFNAAANNVVQAVVLQQDGKILIGGWFTSILGQTRNRIARLNNDGSLDYSFNPDANDFIYSIAVQADGRILVGGTFTMMGGQTRNRIARLNPDGSLDTSFNPDANSTVNSIFVQADGKILVGGGFTVLGGQTRNYIARLNADGSMDTSFNPDANGNVNSIVVQANGKVLVGGGFTLLGGQTRNGIARINADGSLEASFNPDANNLVYSLALQADGKILACGNFTSIGGQSCERIGRINADGTLDGPFNPGANNLVFAIALQSDGRIVVGGNFISMGGGPRSMIARLSNDTPVQSLAVSGASQVDWQRGGSAPEIDQVTFESWNGSAWITQGAAVRVAGGWRSTGLNLPSSGWVRARGRSVSGYGNASGSIIEQIGSYGAAVPEIVVEDAAATNLTAGVGTVAFGSVVTGASAAQTFTIRNTGTAVLTGLAATKDGTSANVFSIGAMGATTLAPGESTTFSVTFSPTMEGPASATLHVASNDGDESPFDILLDGNGFMLPEIAVEQPAANDIVSGATSSFGLTTIGVSEPRVFTIRNMGAGPLHLGTITVTGPDAADFVPITSGTISNLPSGGQTTFLVLFTPPAAGVRNAQLRIANDDTDENPFGIALTGTGVPPSVSVTMSPTSVAEDNMTNLAYTFTRNGPTTDSLNVSFTVSGTATFGSDYSQSGADSFSVNTGTVTFAPGSSTATVTLEPGADTTVETDETVALTLAAGSGYQVVSPNVATGTIFNDDTDLSVAVTPASVVEDGAGNLIFTFSRVGVTSGPLTVDFSVGGTASFGTDYSVSGATSISTTSGMVTFAAGDTTKTVTVYPTVDGSVESDESVVFTVTSGSGYQPASPAAATGTIQDDDTSVSVAVAPASTAEDGVSNLVFTFSRTGVTSGSLTTNFSVSGTATFSTDYATSGAASFSSTSGTVTFAAGATTKTVTIDPATDLMVEGDETVNLTVVSGSGYTVGSPNTASGIITNDDTSVSVAVVPTAVQEDGASNLVFTFTRAGVTSGALTTSFSVTGTSAGTDYTQSGAASFGANSGTVIFSPGANIATITLDPSVDATAESDETVALTVVSGSGYTVGSPSTATGTILNDDTDVSVTVSPSSVVEDGAGNLVFTFSRVGVTSGPITVNFNVGGTAIFASDYSQSGAASFSTTSGTVSFGAGVTTATVTLDPTVDGAFEGDETVLFTVSPGGGYNPVLPDAATGTILDDDTSVSVAVSPTSVTEDGAPNLVFTFTRSGLTTSAASVNFSVGGTAAFGGDFSQSGAASFGAGVGTVGFAAGADTATVTVNPTADTTVEADETVILTVTAGSGYGVGTTAAATGTIVNDDTAVAVQVSPSVNEDGTVNLVYTFTRSGVTGGALTVNFSAGGTASSASDYTLTGAATFNGSIGTLAFGAGVSSVEVTVDPTADTTVESAETVILSITTGSGYLAGSPAAATGTILNDDTAVTVAVSPGSVTEDGTLDLVYSFTRSGVTSGALTANFSVGGTATFTTDYAQSGAASYSSTSGTVTFAAGVTGVSVTINPAADTEVETNETVILTVTGGSGYQIGSPAAATGTINNDDFQPEIAVEQPTGSGLTSAVSSVAFGAVYPNNTISKTFVIRNLGTLPLSGLVASVIGTNNAEFVPVQPAGTVNGGGNASFTVAFTPTAMGARTATLRINSNDADENPFDIALTGTGATARQVFDAWALAAGLSGVNAEPGATPFKDGVPNLLKYAFNMNATGTDVRTLVPTTGTVGLPVVIFTGGASPVIRYEFIRRKNSGLNYTPQQSSTLAAGSWQAMTGTTTVTLMDATWERVVIEQPWQAGASRLLKVQVVME